MIACAQCGTAMPTPTGRASRKRSATSTAAKRPGANGTAATSTPVVPAVPLIVPRVAAVPTAFLDYVPTPGGQHRCPHCRQPLAIISVVIPADEPPSDHRRCHRPLTTALTSSRRLGKMI